MRIALPLLVMAGLCSGQAPKADLCAPPPGSIAPSLPARLMAGMGDVHLPITTSHPDAQKFFDQGLAQMHSFWATEAERSFLQAAQLDPEAPMPHFGIAMVAAGDFRPRHQLDRDDPAPKAASAPRPEPRGGAKRALEAARTAMRLSQVPGKATRLERLYIKAIWARRDPAEADPAAAYIAGLRKVMAEYPAEVEAGTYLALHLSRGFSLPDHQPREGSMEAVAILRDLLERAPDHPGVHHFVIHAWEGAAFASDAWPSCRRYPELASGIPHALHMPGHIWAQTGKWKEAQDSFAAAARKEVEYMEKDALYGDGHHGHNVNFLSAAHGFDGNYEAALRAARSLLEYKENPRQAAQIDNARTAWRQGWFSVMRTLVQFEKWDEILEGSLLPAYDKPREQAWRAWATGLAYAAKGDPRSAAQAAKSMDRELAAFRKKTGQPVPEVLAIALEELRGQILVARGKHARGFGQLQAAARRERAYRYSEPPHYPRPILEALGALALRNGQPELARSAYEEALEQYPGSARAVQALAVLGGPGTGTAAE